MWISLYIHFLDEVKKPTLTKIKSKHRLVVRPRGDNQNGPKNKPPLNLQGEEWFGIVVKI